MSVPLPDVPGTSNGFLDPDERFEVFEVKAAVRPHLLGINCEEENNDDSKDGSMDPPLLDGCDIPAWRKEGLAGSLSSDLIGALRIGAGSHLFRRESQWPCLCNNNNNKASPWEELREKLSDPPVDDIPRVDAQEMAEEVNGVTRFATEWERRNVPVLIENCTKGWKAMPLYEKDNPDANFWNGGGKDGWK